MRNTLDWTFQLLNSDSQRVLRQLAVFRGGVDLEAIEATSADLLPVTRSVLDVVIELVDRSLLSMVEQHDSTRYTLHEAVRDYLLESAAGDELEQYRRRHAHWFAELAARLRDGPEQGRDVA